MKYRVSVESFPRPHHGRILVFLQPGFGDLDGFLDFVLQQRRILRRILPFAIGVIDIDGLQTIGWHTSGTVTDIKRVFLYCDNSIKS